eukprot:4960647-Pleurochrysis_carterae.AAC.8
MRQAVAPPSWPRASESDLSLPSPAPSWPMCAWRSAPLSAAEIEQQHGECAVVVSCTGQQRYVAASNSCEDPDCGSRYVQELDPESRVCVPTEGFRVATLIVLGLLAFGELLFQELHQRLPNRIQRTAARGRNAHGLPATSEE